MIETVDILGGLDDWWVLPVAETAMQRYNAYGFYRIGSWVGRLHQLKEDSPVHDENHTLVRCSLVLESFLEARTVTFSPGCIDAAAKMLDTIREILDIPYDRERPPNLGGNARELHALAQRFETVFASDCMALNLFYIPAVMAYSSTVMIEDGVKLIPESFHQYLSEGVKDDLRSCARCLAFELPTAAAFHMARATEGLMRDYHVQIIGALPTNYQQQTFGSLIQAFSTNTPGSAMVGFLTHVKNHYRNPISHPDLTVGVEDSHKMIGAYVAVMIDMLGEMDVAYKAALQAYIAANPT